MVEVELNVSVVPVKVVSVVQHVDCVLLVMDVKVSVVVSVLVTFD